jgi:opacity protein-like surface antigen
MSEAMQNLKSVVIGCSAAILVGLSGVAASAADLGGAPYRSIKDEPYPEAPYRYYLAVRGGVTFPDDIDYRFGISPTEQDTGFTVSGAAGIRLDGIGLRGFRGELEGGYSEAENSNQPGHTSVSFGLANVYYDFSTGSPLRPFVGAGIGIGDVDDGFASGTGLAYQGTAGVAMNIGGGFDLELAYRYFGVTGADLERHGETLSDGDYKAHQILVGLRKSF